ncbi:hypothetical protein NQ318_021275 [Aromia moschata]|uniref:Uncharacterized protein n=1 Tax=Aromia moschata TaxID=1265417 RepID=A0AAV8ZEP1_9CUCU|nr:hypothetical protein NQ318_021275 [Aromia moschata]
MKHYKLKIPNFGLSCLRSDNVIFAYFQEHVEKMKSSTLWTYSVIDTLLNIKHSIDILTFLKRKSEGHIRKKSKTFSPEEIRTFIDEAPDNQFL